MTEKDKPRLLEIVRSWYPELKDLSDEAMAMIFGVFQWGLMPLPKGMSWSKLYEEVERDG